MMLKFTSQVLTDFNDKVQTKIIGREINKPWMKTRERAVISEIMDRLQPVHIIEWGCGFGTLYYAKHYQNFQSWVSIEHVREWADKIRSMNSDPRLEIIHVPANSSQMADPYNEGSYEEFRDYVDYTDQLGTADFIMIDGRARVDCLRKAYEKLSSYGVVIVHDANRRYYDKYRELFKHNLLLTDYRDGEGGIWIGRHNEPVEDVLDVDAQHKLWNIYNRSKLLRL